MTVFETADERGEPRTALGKTPEDLGRGGGHAVPSSRLTAPSEQSLPVADLGLPPLNPSVIPLRAFIGSDPPCRRSHPSLARQDEEGWPHWPKPAGGPSPNRKLARSGQLSSRRRQGRVVAAPRATDGP